MLPKRKQGKERRASRWRSPAHLKWIRGFHCYRCGSDVNIEAAHVRIGSGAGMGQKPDDWRCIPLCSPMDGSGCHDRQHQIGERTFWAGVDIEAVLEEFARASPKSREIAMVKRERGG